MPNTDKKPTRKIVERVSVTVQERDDPDLDRFAYALLQYARLIANGEVPDPRKRRTK
jgi:hypothetical protein